MEASINKIIRLVGGFEVICSNEEGQRELDEFCAQVPVGASSVGLTQFLYCYLDNLLTYGNAAGEMIPLRNGEGIGALYNVPLSCLKVKQGETPVGVDFFACTDGVKDFVYGIKSKSRRDKGTFSVVRTAVCIVHFAQHLSGDRTEL